MSKPCAERVQAQISNLASSIGSCLKILLRSKYKVRLPTTKVNECIIMGNGPSMKTVVDSYGDKLLEKKLWAVNYFANSELYTKVQPSYYLIVGPEFWREEVREKNKILRKKLFDNFKAKTEWPITIFLPHEAFKSKFLASYLGVNKNLTFQAFNTTPVEGIEKVNHFLFKSNLGMPRPHNVIIPTLMVALNMGFKRIYLTGVEHSWLPTISVNENNEVLFNNKHFYDPKEQKDHKMYLLGTRTRRLHEILHKFMLTFDGYFIIDDFASSLNATIFNTTQGSFIDAFKRRDIEEILK